MIRKLKDLIDNYRLSKGYKKMLKQDTTKAMTLTNLNYLNVMDI